MVTWDKKATYIGNLLTDVSNTIRKFVHAGDNSIEELLTYVLEYNYVDSNPAHL